MIAGYGLGRRVAVAAAMGRWRKSAKNGGGGGEKKRSVGERRPLNQPSRAAF